jgi:hypothetical protein
MQRLGHGHVDLLKLDVEGSEYSVVEDILNSNARVDQFLVEVHERFFPDGRARTEKLLDALIDRGYEIYAIATRARHYSLYKAPN